MNEIIGRWQAGDGHRHQGCCFEIVLEHTASGWAVLYFEHGELHGRVGFDDQHEAQGDIDWLMSKLPAGAGPWQRVD